jgi:hypothetical protein
MLLAPSAVACVVVLRVAWTSGTVSSRCIPVANRLVDLTTVTSSSPPARVPSASPKHHLSKDAEEVHLGRRRRGGTPRRRRRAAEHAADLRQHHRHERERGRCTRGGGWKAGQERHTRHTRAGVD